MLFINSTPQLHCARKPWSAKILINLGYLNLSSCKTTFTPSLSPTLAGQSEMAKIKPKVSVTIKRSLPCTFLLPCTPFSWVIDAVLTRGVPYFDYQLIPMRCFLLFV